MTVSSLQRRIAFRRQVQARQGLLVAGVFNALSARIAADIGFEALYLSGAGVTNMALGLPDLGFVGLDEMAGHTARLRDTVDLPLIVDADTGFGNALNVRQAVRTLERSGADAIQFEDQVLPKNVGISRARRWSAQRKWSANSRRQRMRVKTRTCKSLLAPMPAPSKGSRPL